jgi:hypothetical protein
MDSIKKAKKNNIIISCIINVIIMKTKLKLKKKVWRL